jgi:HTH-type transcriptional regulator / antitoxin HipB
MVRKNKDTERGKLKIYTLEEMIDTDIGKKGTPARDHFDYKVKMGVLGHMIQQTRKKRKLTQAQLGKIVGVQKAQISKLESGAANSARVDTILKVFKALKAKVQFRVIMENKELSLDDI